MDFWAFWNGHEKSLTSRTRTILVMNSKGGSGKTTLATNVASYYAGRGVAVALADFDPQGSSVSWLADRPADRPVIHGVAAWRDPLRVPQEVTTVVMDIGAGVRDGALARLMSRAESILIPVLPSAIDIRAAGDFFNQVADLRRRNDLRAKMAVVANRVRESTRIAGALTAFLDTLDLPIVAHLRDSQHYVAAAERGLGIFELAPSAVSDELAQWDPLLAWLRHPQSRPKAA